MKDNENTRKECCMPKENEKEQTCCACTCGCSAQNKPAEGTSSCC